MGNVIGIIGQTLEVIGGVICAIGVIYFLVIWISQDPAFFVWEWTFGIVFSAGFGAILIFIDLVSDMINNFEQFYPSFIIAVIGCIVLGLGSLLGNWSQGLMSGLSTFVI